MLECAARCGMGEDEFWYSTPRYFHARHGAYCEDRSGWEQARFVAYHMIKTVDSKKVIKSVTDLVSFPWDVAKVAKFEPIDAEEQAAFDRDADEIMRKYHPALYNNYDTDGG